MPERTCSIEGCGKIVSARGWCSTHYSRWQAHGDPLTVHVRPEACSIEGCERPHQARGWCKIHWQRWSRHGDPLSVILVCLPGDAEARFWPRVNKNGPTQPHVPHLGPCWMWVGRVVRAGYGAFDDGHWRSAHRFSYALHHGTIPDGLHILHKCDNPPCCNPDHLFLGTQADNMIDMVAKGRHGNAVKTHCKWGHEFTPENTIRRNDGGRRCRTCRDQKRAA